MGSWLVGGSMSVLIKAWLKSSLVGWKGVLWGASEWAFVCIFGTVIGCDFAMLPMDLGAMWGSNLGPFIVACMIINTEYLYNSKWRLTINSNYLRRRWAAPLEGWIYSFLALRLFSLSHSHRPSTLSSTSILCKSYRQSGPTSTFSRPISCSPQCHAGPPLVLSPYSGT